MDGVAAFKPVDRVPISALPTVEDSQPPGSPGLPGAGNGTGTSESPDLKEKSIDDTVSFNDSIGAISSVDVNINESDGGPSG